MKWEEEDQKALVSDFAKAANLSLPDAKFIYSCLCDRMLIHLAVHKRSVNMGFAFIHPSPYRANWKDQVFRAMNWVFPMMTGKSTQEKWRIWHEGLGAGTMANPSLMGGMRGLVFFTPELQPTKVWWRTTVGTEKNKRKLLGAAKYRKYVMGLLIRLYERLVLTWFSWRSQISLPGVRVLESRSNGRYQYFIETRRVRSLRATDADIRFPPARPPKRLDDFGSEDFENSVEKPYEELPKVPVPQPKADDMRDGTQEHPPQ